MACRSNSPTTDDETTAQSEHRTESSEQLRDCRCSRLAAASALFAAVILHTFSDGGARGNPGPSAIGVVLCNPEGKVIAEAAECIGHMTNNKAEYRAMLKALEMARAHKATQLICYGDSELLIYQLQGIYRIKNVDLQKLAEKVKSAAKSFDTVQWKQVPREHPMIARADKLLNQALNRAKTQAPEKEMNDTEQRELF